MSPVPPQPTPRPHPLAHTRPPSRPVPPKTRHSPAPPVPGPAPSNPTPRPASSPRLHHFSPPIRPDPQIIASPLETRAHQCYPRPSEGPTPLPCPTGHSAKAPGLRRAVVDRPLIPDAPLSSSVTRRHSCVPKTRAGRYRFAQDRRCPQLRGAQNVAESDRFLTPALRGAQGGGVTW